MDYTIVSEPRISTSLFRRALVNRKSPAAPLSDELYKVCVAWNVDPAVALAMFVHESQAGTRGAAVRTRNWGNLRKGPGQMRIAETGVSGAFAVYASWIVGLNDYCKLIRGPIYEGNGLRTVGQIIPKYAPTADRNNPTAYVDAVNAMVALWERLTLREAEQRGTLRDGGEV